MQENWLEQVTTKKGQSNWSIASLCSELVAKMAKDIGMTIRKGIVVPFLPCLVAFWGFHPYMFFHFLKRFFVTLYIKTVATCVSVMLEKLQKLTGICKKYCYQIGNKSYKKGFLLLVSVRSMTITLHDPNQLQHSFTKNL